MEDLEDIARSADVDLLGGAAGTMSRGGGSGAAGVVRFSRSHHRRRSPVPPIPAAPAAAAADKIDDEGGGKDGEDGAFSTPTATTPAGADVDAGDDVDGNDDDGDDDGDGALSTTNPSLAPRPFRLDSSGLGGAPTAVPRVWLRTFGCAHNVADSETMAGVLKEAGFDVTVGTGTGDGGGGDHGGGDAESEKPGAGNKSESLSPASSADAWVVNSCTVKGPSQAAVGKLVAQAQKLGKPIVVAGCVPQGEPKSKDLEGASLLGVRQLDRVADVVAEALKGNVVRLTSAARSMPALDLPRVRRNAHVEIVPLSTGCLGRCTYCKTVHARGKLGSYPLDAVVARVAAAARDPRVREVWLSSEDTGAYGRDLGASLPQLLRALVAVLPEDGRTMLRVGMTNPPYVLSYLEELGELLGGGGGGMRGGVEEKKKGEGGGVAATAAAGTTSSPSPSLSTSPPLLPIFRFLHVPVQSGSDAVLRRMRREYSVAEFERVAAAVHQAGATLATDVIVGFPGETAEDAQLTVDLITKWRPRATHVSKFYPRPGTPAARWERPPAREVAARSRAVASAVDTLKGAWDHLVGTIQRVWVVDVAADGQKLVGHTRDYAQVLLLPRKKGGKASEEEEEASSSSASSAAGRSCLGASLGDVLEVEVTSASRWSVRGRVTRIVLDGDEAAEEASRMRLEEEEEGGGGEGQQPEQQGRGGGKAAGKGEAVVPAPRRRGASAAAAASIAAAAAASSSPTSPPPPRPETPEAPALPRSRAGKKEEEEDQEASVEAAVSTAHPSPSHSPSSSSALFRLLALAMLIFSFAVALALRGRAAKRGEMEETLL